MAIIEFKKKSNKVFQFRIDIAGAKPPIWRRILVNKIDKIDNNIDLKGEKHGRR